MPPPNTPEEFFEEEYRQRRNSAAANAANSSRRRRFNLPPHDEDLDESASERERHSHPHTSQSESRRASEDRRLSVDRSISRSSSNSSSHSPQRARRHSRERAPRSASPSTVGPAQSDYDADYEHYYDIHPDDSRAAAGHFRGPNDQSQSRGAAIGDHDHDSSPSRTEQQLELYRRELLEDYAQQAEHRDDTPLAEAGPALAPSPPPLDSSARLRQSLVMPDAPRLRPRRRAKTPKMDWHALEYIGSYDENLDCPICRSPLVRPEITTCFHIFCHKCLVKTLEHGNRCPIDREPIQYFETSRGRVPSRPAPPVIANQLDNLQVRCPNARCDHVCARSRVEDHYKNECPFTKIPCPDPACDKLVARRESEDADGGADGGGSPAGCLHKTVACVYCGKPVELAALDDHYDADCNQKELMCEHCLAAVPRHRHGTHVANCVERQTECKYRASGCSYTAKKKDFGDHERTCLYGMILRMNRAHRADMDSMETVLQDSQDRVRKLELEMAARPPVLSNQPAAPAAPPLTVGSLHASMSMSMPIGPPQSYDLPHSQPSQFDSSHYLGSYYDNANGSGTSGRDAPTRPTSPRAGGSVAARHAAAGAASDNDDDRMSRIVAYIDIFDAKVENLERYLGEVDARQAQLFMNELGPLKDQILELRNSMGHISMYVRWLMESFRQTTKRSVGLGNGAAGGAGGGGGGGGGSSSSVSNVRGGDDDGMPAGRPPPSASAGTAARHGPPSVVRGPAGGGMALPLRRMSDRENPPRL